MNYDSNIIGTIAFIEENIKEKISVSDCARYSGYSEYHFIRIFKETTALTPADYIRKRKLTEIVKNIRPGVPISEVAFEYGFNSKENFTRAFLSEHNILPTEYKSAMNCLKLYEAITFGDIPFYIVPEVMKIESFSIIGYIGGQENPPSFWNIYNAKRLSIKLSGGKICEDYGICFWDADKNKLDYFIGIRKENASGDIRGTNEFYVKSGLYAVFTTPKSNQFDYVNTVHRTWDFIYNEWLPNSGYKRTGDYEYESYIEQSRTYSEKIFIPIEKQI